MAEAGGEEGDGLPKVKGCAKARRDPAEQRAVQAPRSHSLHGAGAARGAGCKPRSRLRDYPGESPRPAPPRARESASQWLLAAATCGPVSPEAPGGRTWPRRAGSAGAGLAGAGRWVPLLLGLLQSTLGKPLLPPPQNVTLLSRDFGVYLTWLPGPGYSQNVTYFVAYQSAATPRRWRKVQKCKGTKELVCPLMCLEKQDLYNKFKGRVWAASAGARSPMVESKYLDYLFEVEPAPPTLVVTRTEEVLSINATYELPHCMPQPDLKYEVDFWKEGIKNKTRFPVTPRGRPVQIPLQPAASGHYCLSARTIYTFGDPKYSEFSKPTCFFLDAPGASWAFLVLLPLLLSLLLVIAISFVIWKSFRENPWFQRTKMPWALDFSGYRYPVATLHPSGPEPLDTLILCPQKELTRRVWPSPGVRTPATIQAGPEKNSAEEEDDEEDADDNVSFQPYLEPPSFLGQEHQILGNSETGDTWSPPVQVEGWSAIDASDRSWASTGGSSPWDESESSCCLAKKTPGQGPGGDGCQEPLPLPEFSKDLSFLEDPQKDDLSSWTSWGSLSPGLDLLPGEPPVSLRTLTFCWDSNPEEEEEEEEDEEESEDGGGRGGGGWRESEIEDDCPGSWGAGSLQKTEVRGQSLGHYMAR
ncbi:interferon lambda receptor 1 [Meles meles]|uniref:interferon lambda receptor 1 n=1 Tax=Meles meles TaxID=9662 RepID=UPI001E6996E6|nr:interferon lambda receptor 1 [Meles meles]